MISSINYNKSLKNMEKNKFNFSLTKKVHLNKSLKSVKLGNNYYNFYNNKFKNHNVKRI